MTVLITGFGPFDGGSNASERLIEALREALPELSRLAGQRIITSLLPVDSSEAPRALSALMAEHAPHFVLLTGQAAGRSAICLEQRAVNRLDFSIPDEAGRLIAGQPIEADGLEARESTWPDAAGAVAAIVAAGIPCRLSQDCGTYLCNQVLFAVLAAASAGDTHRAMFMHVPLTPEQVAAGEPAALRHPDCPSLPVADTVRAVEILLKRLALGGSTQVAELSDHA